MAKSIAGACLVDPLSVVLLHLLSESRPLTVRFVVSICRFDETFLRHDFIDRVSVSINVVSQVRLPTMIFIDYD